MPISYNPGVQNQAAQYKMLAMQQMGESIRQALANAGEAIGKVAEAKAARKKETTLYRALMATAHPESKDLYDTMGLEQLKGVFQGETLRNAVQEQQQRQTQYQQQQQGQTALKKFFFDLGAQSNAAPEGTTEAGGMSYAPGRGPAGAAPAPGTRSALTPDLMMRVASQNPAMLNTPEGQQIVRSLLQQQMQPRYTPGTVLPSPVPGYTGVVSSTKGGVEWLPNPAAPVDTSKAPPMFDLGGGLKGYWETGANGRPVFKTTKGNPRPRTMPATTAATLTQLEQQLGGVLADLGEENVKPNARQELEARKKRLTAQIDQIHKGFDAEQEGGQGTNGTEGTEDKRLYFRGGLMYDAQGNQVGGQ